MERTPSDALSSTADINGDGTVGLDDYDILALNWGASVAVGSIAEGDLDANGIVDEGDYEILAQSWGAGQAGEVNGDGLVGNLDLNVVLGNWNQCVSSTSEGDLSYDGYVGIDDLSEVLAHWGQGGLLPGMPMDPGSWNNTDSPLGTNLGSVSYWSPDWVFGDAMKMSRPWLDENWSELGSDALDEAGWPTSVSSGDPVQTLVFRELDGHYPAGEYTLMWTGSGTVSVDFDAPYTSSSSGSMTFDVTPGDNGIRIQIHQSDESDPVRDMELSVPGLDYPGQTFHPTFVDTLDEFSVIRFMDWQHTNSTDLVDWSDRPLPTDATQGGDEGVSLEYMIELSNLVHADPWFCMPHTASDDFVRSFATMVRDDLDPDLQVYVELSNEVWNTQFSQSDHARQMGSGLDSNQWRAGYYWTSQRSMEIFDIWEEVFGGTDRLVRVLAAQAANPWVAESMLDYNGAGYEVDALAIAPYFGLTGDHSASEYASMSDAQIVADARQAMQDNLDELQDHVSLVDHYGIDLIAYEGGQHLTAGVDAGNDAFVNALISANRSDEMGGLYDDYLAQWRSAGGTMFVHFNLISKYNQWGSWGGLEWQDGTRSDSPKHDAILDFMSQNPRWF